MEADVKKLELLNKELELELELVKNNLRKIEEQRINEENKNKALSIEKQELQEKLDSILYSRSYKAICKIKKIMGRK